MSVPQCVDAPDEQPSHGVRGSHVVVITVIVVVITLACAGVSPTWVIAVGALYSLLTNSMKEN